MEEREGEREREREREREDRIIFKRNKHIYLEVQVEKNTKI